MNKVIEYDCVCDSCKGTGLYHGMGEGKGFAVVCHSCEGKGWKHVKITYEETDRIRRGSKDVQTVLEINPGICAGVDVSKGLTFSSFGGMPYVDWFSGKSFPKKSEMRKYTCPCWWYQNADYDKKPDWKECESSWGRSFSGCDNFCNKEDCWKRFDKEQAKK